MKHLTRIEIPNILFKVIINFKNYFINITGDVSLLRLVRAGMNNLKLTITDV